MTKDRQYYDKKTALECVVLENVPELSDNEPVLNKLLKEIMELLYGKE